MLLNHRHRNFGKIPNEPHTPDSWIVVLVVMLIIIGLILVFK